MRKRWLSALWTQSVFVITSRGEALEEAAGNSPSLCPNFDLVHLQDASDSFRKQNLNGVKTLMVDVLNIVKEREEGKNTAFRVGMASFVDKPFALVGLQEGILGSTENDWEYELIDPLKSTASAESFGQGLRYGGGGDTLEAQLSAVKKSLSDAKMKWRAGKDTTRVLVMVTNSAFHVEGDLEKSKNLYERAWDSGELCALLSDKVSFCEDPHKLSNEEKEELFGLRDIEREALEEYPSGDEIVGALRDHDAYLVIVVVKAEPDVAKAWNRFASLDKRLMVLDVPYFDSTASDLATVLLDTKRCTSDITSSTPLPVVVPPTIPKVVTEKVTQKEDTDGTISTEREVSHEVSRAEVETKAEIEATTLPLFDKEYTNPKTTTTTDVPENGLPPPKKGMSKGAVAGAAVGGSVGAVAVGAAIMKGVGGSMFGQSSVPNVTQTAEASGQNPQMERETLEAIDADMFA